MRQEFDRFVADAGDKLLRAAYLMTWDLADAEDLVQECLFKIARRWPRVPISTRDPGCRRAWLPARVPLPRASVGQPRVLRGA